MCVAGGRSKVVASHLFLACRVVLPAVKFDTFPRNPKRDRFLHETP